jgi:hypothetical protein
MPYRVKVELAIKLPAPIKIVIEFIAAVLLHKPTKAAASLVLLELRPMPVL